LLGTGVAFALLSAEKSISSPTVLNRWPGPYVVTGKVRTALHYQAGHNGALTWGETCPAPEDIKPGQAVKTWFKLNLDEQYPNRDESSPVEDVRMWYKDFLMEVHRHIERYFSELEWDLSAMKVHYIFSVPTTWAGRPVQDEFKAIIQECGFGPEADIGLSEAEASAVYAARNREYLFEVTTFS
jgi:hypothetical protein